MIVDASAVLAILLGEPEGQRFMQALSHVPEPWMSAVNYVESAIRLDRLPQRAAETGLDAFMASSGIVVRPVSPAQASIARIAHATFGKGRHPARLNLGDCFAYALARDTGRPLLFKGGDFARTDIVPALPLT